MGRKRRRMPQQPPNQLCTCSWTTHSLAQEERSPCGCDRSFLLFGALLTSGKTKHDTGFLFRRSGSLKAGISVVQVGRVIGNRVSRRNGRKLPGRCGTPKRVREQAPRMRLIRGEAGGGVRAFSSPPTPPRAGGTAGQRESKNRRHQGQPRGQLGSKFSQTK